MKANNKDLVSIIVPVYNVEKYLSKCIDSIRNQSYSNIEVFLIDDGSTDRSGIICDDYMKRDNRIKVFHKKNGGQGSARNVGLDYSNGTYICFVDSDDCIKSDYVEFLLDGLKKHDDDVFACNSENYFENGTYYGNRVKEYDEYIEFSGIETIESLWYNGKINIAPWGKMFKRELWNNIRFEECYSEDFATMHKVYCKANKVGYSGETKLLYLIRDNSSIRAFKDSKLVMLDIAKNNIQFAIEENNDRLIEASYHKALSVHFHILFQLPKHKKYDEYRIIIKNFIIKNRYRVLKNKKTSMKVKIAIFISYFSFRIVEKVFFLAKKNKIIV